MGSQPPLSEQRNFDKLYIPRPRRWIIGILIAYVVLAANFAFNTPRWQAPDEPAHYNYIAHIAHQRQLPVLHEGDYDQQLLGLLHQTRFEDETMVSRLRYESYQPPLYYLLATPVYWLSGGSLLALRLLSVVIGAGVLVLLYRALELVFPGKPLITVSATAFAALLPMHVALMAAVTNDGLAELLIMASLLIFLGWMRAHFRGSDQGNRPLLALGLLLGLGLLTKVYAYGLLLVLCCAIVLVVWRRAGQSLAQGVRTALWTATPAVVLAAPWWARNWVLYGAWDILGTAWHDVVVVGQPRTVDWLADIGWDRYLERASSFTFRSFWGVFGWLGVFMDERIYTALLLFTGIIFLGALWALVRLISGGPDMDMDDFQVWVLVLFAAILVTVFAAYIGYNFKFVQHQGRYFFWGLLPLSTFFALGWREVLRPFQGLITAILAGVLAFAFAIIGYTGGNFDKWTIATTLAMTLFLLCQPLVLIGAQRPGSSAATVGQGPGWRWLTQSATVVRWVIWATPFFLLALLNLLIPMLYILPQLSG